MSKKFQLVFEQRKDLFNKSFKQTTYNEVSRNKGKSQFIKSKFDRDYDPKPHVIKSLSVYSKADRKVKVDSTLLQNKQLASLVHQTQQQLKSGKKIIIDWSEKNKFRTTRFPSIQQKTPFINKRAKTQQICTQNLDSPKAAKYYQYLQKFNGNQQLKQIVTKGELLRNLLSESIMSKKIPKKKIHRQKNFYKNSQIQNSSESQSYQQSDKSKITLAQLIQKKQSQFVQKNREKIIKAINYQKSLQQNIQKSGNMSKPMKIDMVHERIIQKSKLTLLKSDLAKKFKQIRDTIIDNSLRNSTFKPHQQL